MEIKADGVVENCMDIQKESFPEDSSPIRSLRKIQSWTCNPEDIQQQFEVLYDPTNVPAGWECEEVEIF